MYLSCYTGYYVNREIVSHYLYLYLYVHITVTLLCAVGPKTPHRQIISLHYYALFIRDFSSMSDVCDYVVFGNTLKYPSLLNCTFQSYLNFSL